MLWHNGVLGYDCTDADADHADFYSGLEAGHFHLPLDKPTYVLHPSIPHLIHMKHSGPVPVRAYRRI